MKKIDLKNIKYLSFEGGGGKGIAYLGAVRALEEKYYGSRKPLINIRDTNFYNISDDEVKKRIENRAKSLSGIYRREKEVLGISGSSAGAITAFMVAMGMNSLEIESVFNRNSTTRIDEPVSTKDVYITPIPIKFETISKSKNIPVSYFEKLIDDDYGEQPKTRVWEKVKDTENTYQLGILKYKDYSSSLQWAYLQAHGLIKYLADSKFLLEKLTDAHIGQNLYCLLHERGMLSGIKARKVFGELMDEFLLKKIGYPKKPEQITFQRFFRLTGVDLVITGSNVSTGKPKLFSVYHTPDFPVIEAVSISMNLPFIFKPLMIDALVHRDKEESYNNSYKGLYVDGGVVNNLPFRVFNNLKPVYLSKHKDAGDILVSAYDYNETSKEPYERELWTLAFGLVDSTPPKTSRNDLFEKDREILIGGLSGGLFSTVLYSSSDGQFRNDSERNNKIELEITGIPTADFASPDMNNYRKDTHEILTELMPEEFKSNYLGDLKKYWIKEAYLKIKGKGLSSKDKDYIIINDED